MEIIITAFVFGLMGSFHCAGMCGPIALSLPLRGYTLAEKIFGGIIYNLGRTAMYGIMGALFGLIGSGFKVLGFQQWISIIMGLMLIASILFPVAFKKSNLVQNNLIIQSVRKAIQRLFTNRSFGGLFLIGLLNSLLPCGLVYLAIAAAIAIGDTFEGMLYLIFFGLGTLPMMLFISILGNLISLSVRKTINRIIPYIVAVIGIIFIFRGLCLGIPYLSPSKDKLDIIIQMKSKESGSRSNTHEGSCCHKE